MEDLRSPEVHFSPFLTRMIFHPPAYPYFIALTGTLFGGLSGVKVAQAVVGALLVPAVGRLGRRGFGESVGLLAAALVALYPDLVWFTSHFWAETLFTTLLWWALERYAALLDPETSRSGRGRLGLAIVAGLLLGLAILTRETVLYFLPVLTAGLVLTRRGLLVAAASVLAVLTLVAPWTWRNHVVFGAFVPVSTAGGLNLFQGNAKLTRQQVYDEYNAVRGRIARYEFARRKGVEAILERQPWWLLEKFRDEGPKFLEADSQALVHLRRGAYGEPRLLPALGATVVVVLPFFAVLVFLVPGVAVLPRNRVATLVTGFLAYYTLIHIATHGYARYRIPVLPSLFLLAAVGFGSVSALRWRNLSTRRKIAAVTTALLLAAAVAPSARFLLRSETLVSENARFGLDPQGQPLDDLGGER
jgi:4-amino-4-deoxy-L-arabinose transferase-like glycosyltransferase